MSEATAFQAVDWLLARSGPMKQVQIGFFGGEPLLRFPLMKAVVAYARRQAAVAGKRVDFHVTTNGTLLDEEKVSFIKDEKLSVMVSFDGPREIQDAQRPFADGRGSYDAILPGVRRLLAAVPKVQGHAVLARDSDPEVVKDELRRIGFAGTTFIPASASLFSAGPGAGRRDTEAVMRLLEREAEDWVLRLKTRDATALQDLKSKSQLLRALTCLLHNFKRRYACGAGVWMVGISCSGDVYLCHRFVGKPDFRLGSVFHAELDRAQYGRSPADFVAACAGCFARYYCAGGCKHDNAGCGGSAFSPAEDICRLKRRELELAAVLSSRFSLEDRAFLAEHGVVPVKPCPLDF
jgi:uncharacterized protein